MTLNTMMDLYVNLLQDTYNAEKQLIKALPRIAKGAASSELSRAIAGHLDETRQQVGRLEKIFKDLEKRPGGEQCEAMEGLLEEGKEILDADAEEAVRDAAIIVAAQKVEHYEIAAYGSLCAFARMLGRDEDERLLRQTLEEEEGADEKLTMIATSSVNAEAAALEEAGAGVPAIRVRPRRSNAGNSSRSRGR